jgi:hypothetical protein
MCGQFSGLRGYIYLEAMGVESYSPHRKELRREWYVSNIAVLLIQKALTASLSFISKQPVSCTFVPLLPLLYFLQLLTTS